MKKGRYMRKRHKCQGQGRGKPTISNRKIYYGGKVIKGRELGSIVAGLASKLVGPLLQLVA